VCSLSPLGQTICDYSSLLVTYSDNRIVPIVHYSNKGFRWVGFACAPTLLRLFLWISFCSGFASSLILILFCFHACAPTLIELLRLHDCDLALHVILFWLSPFSSLCMWSCSACAPTLLRLFLWLSFCSGFAPSLIVITLCLHSCSAYAPTLLRLLLWLSYCSGFALSLVLPALLAFLLCLCSYSAKIDALIELLVLDLLLCGFCSYSACILALPMVLLCLDCFYD
jgi:hypothetical protein